MHEASFAPCPVCMLWSRARTCACAGLLSVSDHWRVRASLSGHLLGCRCTRRTAGSFVRLTDYMVVCTRSAGVQVAAATAIVVIGGDYGGSRLSSGERYDPAADAWSPIASMGTARDSHAAAVIDGLLYAIGGWAGDSLSSGERYDPAADAWSPIASMGTARDRHAAGAL